jgi:phenylalanyl-tRNA synthetase beta chain
MRVPLSWLREFVPLEVEPRRLAEDLTLAGLEVGAVEQTGDEAVFEMDITTNRVDCMNVYGVAREAAALYNLPLAPIDTSVPKAGPPLGAEVDVVVEAPDLCGRFCVGVLDVRLGPSPAWLRERLELVGIRSINNVVDLTNYVMVEMGQPSHAFDLGRVPGGRLVVRWSRPGERLRTLDGVERTLPAGVGLIAGQGGEPPLALAGIMGGASSEVSDETRTVALEAAWWEPLAVRRAARSLGMRTEASHRFERGADFAGGPTAIARLGHLLAKAGAGTIRPGIVDRLPLRRPPRRIVLRPSRVSALLGVEVPVDRQVAILQALGFGVQGGGGRLAVAVPTWRGDVAREADLVEEVGRHFGLQRIPSSVPPALDVGVLRPSQRRERRIREVLAGLGLTEVIGYSFVAGAELQTPADGRVRLANPITEAQDTLRTSLVVPGLLTTLETNLRLGRRDMALFELGRVFLRGEPGVREEPRLAVLLSGSAHPPHWSARPRPFDLFDLKGLLAVLLERLGLAPAEIDREAALPTHYHPGGAMGLRVEGRLVGFGGALHPDVCAARGLREAPVVLEMALDAVLEAAPRPARFLPPDRFPAAVRDLSVLCDETTTAAELEARVRRAAGEELRAVSVLDRYTGDRLPPGKVSLTLSLRFQDRTRTLTNEEVQESVNGVVRELRAAGLEIRGE